ncbi:MAG: HEPN domain-containing protein [Methanophagales archaeon]|nr:HEPN domain-containing protein [Methanophagales archaeon]
MTQLNKLINSVKELGREAKEIDKKVTGWLSYYFTYYYINDLDTEALWLEESFREEQRKCVQLYQIWYLTAECLIKKYLPDRKREFTREYGEILGLLQLRKNWAKVDVHYIIKEFTDRFDMQRNLLLSLPKVFEIQNLELRKTISADLVESELDEAELLLDQGFIRAAGAVAGVALERYLKTLCEISTPPVEYNNKKDGISQLALNLCSAGQLSETKRKKMSYLGDIRNKCDHPKEEEPRKEEVKELIKWTKDILIQKRD